MLSEVHILIDLIEDLTRPADLDSDDLTERFRRCDKAHDDIQAIDKIRSQRT